jgi:hypothetical protein
MTPLSAATEVPPAPRTIPPGKVLLGDYGDAEVKQNHCVVTVLATAWSAHVKADVSLIESSPGFESAGSVARWTNGYCAVRWYQDGARHGQRYKPDQLDAARQHFTRLTAEQYDFIRAFSEVGNAIYYQQRRQEQFDAGRCPDCTRYDYGAHNRRCPSRHVKNRAPLSAGTD